MFFAILQYNPCHILPPYPHQPLPFSDTTLVAVLMKPWQIPFHCLRHKQRLSWRWNEIPCQAEKAQLKFHFFFVFIKILGSRQHFSSSETRHQISPYFSFVEKRKKWNFVLVLPPQRRKKKTNEKKKRKGNDFHTTVPSRRSINFP